MLIRCVLIDGISYSAFMALLGKHVICQLCVGAAVLIFLL